MICSKLVRTIAAQIAPPSLTGIVATNTLDVDLLPIQTSNCDSVLTLR